MHFEENSFLGQTKEELLVGKRNRESARTKNDQWESKTKE